MTATPNKQEQFEVHDAGVLRHARDLIDSSPSLRLVQQEVVNAVTRNAIWRGDVARFHPKR